MPEHGGQLRQAAAASPIPLAEWLDLSTGINPRGWPVPPLPPQVWQRLPEAEDGLEAAAQTYYQTPHLLPVAGSQMALQLLPRLFPKAGIACLGPLYSEHPVAWREAGHLVRNLPAGNLQRALGAATPRVLLCNPNNPTTHLLTRPQLLEAAATLKKRGGWLFVDEAFIDATPEHSLADLAGDATCPNLVIFRSLGKFFGLAGARAGFLLGPAALLDAVRQQLGPWPLSHPTRWVATQALRDKTWHSTARQQLQQDSQRLQALLTPLCAGSLPPAHTAFFAILSQENGFSPAHAHSLFRFLKTRGILIRHFQETGMLRFGLPGTEAEWQKLATALQEWKMQG